MSPVEWGKGDTMTITQAIRAIRRAAKHSPDLLKGYAYNKRKPIAGHCYIASEALHHLFPHLKPHVMRVAGGTHWFLVDEKGLVVDPTSDQFTKPINYTRGKGCGFLTKKPSKRTAILLERAGLKKTT